MEFPDLLEEKVHANKQGELGTSNANLHTHQSPAALHTDPQLFQKPLPCRCYSK